MTSFLGCIFALIIDCFIRHSLLGFLLNGVIMCFTFCDLSITFYKITLFTYGDILDGHHRLCILYYCFMMPSIEHVKKQDISGMQEHEGSVSYCHI